MDFLYYFNTKIRIFHKIKSFLFFYKMGITGDLKDYKKKYDETLEVQMKSMEVWLKRVENQHLRSNVRCTETVTRETKQMKLETSPPQPQPQPQPQPRPPESTPNASCMICMNTYDDDSHRQIGLIPCGHCICKSCLKPSMTRCCYCRRDMKGTLPLYN